jgi:hypothetical protein
VACSDCKTALQHSDEDPCPNSTLILTKQYDEDRTRGARLVQPSGTLFKLLKQCEKTLRSFWDLVTSKNAEMRLVSLTLQTMNYEDIFPTLGKEHSFYTQVQGDSLN